MTKKIRYPKSRSSPVKHKVKGYTREDGTKIKGHTRGKGTRAQKPRRTRVVGKRITDDDTPIGVHAFTVNFKYSEKPDDGESVIVFSNNYVDALDEAWEERVDIRTPIAVEAIDPDIGAALEWVGKRVKSVVEYGKPRIKRAAHLGAKYAVKATVATGKTIGRVAKATAISGVEGAKELGRLTAFGVQKELIQNLLGLCYQEDKAKRIAARIALKKRYPDVYSMCSFSREGRGRSRSRVPEVVRLPIRHKSQAVV